MFKIITKDVFNEYIFDEYFLLIDLPLIIKELLTFV